MRSSTERLGPLTCRILEPSEHVAILDVVLCHGFGAGGDDLVPLAGALCELRPELEQKVRFVFPEAPLELGFGGRAWWPLDLERFVGERGTIDRSSLRTEEPEGLGTARRLLLGLLEALFARTGHGPAQLVLGGFSQGAMLATDVTLRLEEAPASLVVFSGTLLCEAVWSKRAPARAGLSVLLSHGTEDPLLAFEDAQALAALLTRSGLLVETVPFRGGHTIAPQALARFAERLAASVA